MTTELGKAKDYWVVVIQRERFAKMIDAVQHGDPLHKDSKLLSFQPIGDDDCSVICVGGRMSSSSLTYSQSHPVILNGKHSFTKIII